MRLFDDDDFAAAPGAAERLHRTRTIPALDVVVADPSVDADHGWVTGANEADHHVRNAVLGPRLPRRPVGRAGQRRAGRPVPAVRRSELAVDRGIEVGHVFQIGTKYSEPLDARYQDEPATSTRW